MTGFKTQLQGNMDNGKGDNLQSTYYDDIILEQNNPNPFSETSQISYYIPKKYKGTANIVLTNESGEQIIQEKEVCIGKPCQMIIFSKDLQTGVYIYGITIRGKIVIYKKMLIIK